MKKKILIFFVILTVLGIYGFISYHKSSDLKNSGVESEKNDNSKPDYIITDIEKLSDYDNEKLEDGILSNVESNAVKEDKKTSSNSGEVMNETSQEIKKNNNTNNTNNSDKKTNESSNVISKNEEQSSPKPEEKQQPVESNNSVIEKVEDKPKEDLTKIVDTENFFYSIHKGKVEFNKMNSCVNAGMDIAFLDVVDINYYRCYEVLSKAGTTMGYYLNIFCNSGNCDKYKSQVDLKNY